MLKKKDFERRYRELVARTKDSLLEEGNRLLNCGAVDLDNYEDDYLLVKTILYVAMDNIRWQWKPLSKEGREEAKNLDKF